MNTTTLATARTALGRAERERDAALADIEALPDTVGSAEVDFASERFDVAQARFERSRREVEQLERSGNFASPRGAHHDEPVYRPDKRDVSFLRDVETWRLNPDAAERLARNERQVTGEGIVLVGKRKVPISEVRDVTTGNPGAVGFLPPVYLVELAYLYPRFGRPFADAVNTSVPLPDYGLSLTVPRVTGGTTVAVQANQGDAVSETDVQTDSVSVPVVTIAGQNDLSIQAIERTQPGMDQIVFQDLLADYDSKLDVQLIAGTGANNQHRGIRSVVGIETVTYTATTPNQVDLLPKIYGGAAAIATDYKRGYADLLVWHPRRSAWMAAGMASTHPLFQLGSLFQASGQQERGFTTPGPLGFVEVRDGNIGTTYGAGTNQDEIYLAVSRELFLMEGALRMRTADQTLGGQLITRLQVVAFSAFASMREPHAIANISGSGLTAPTF